MIPRTGDDWMSWLPERGREIVTAIAFSTRLPLARVVPAETSSADLATAIWALPLAGLLVGADRRCSLCGRAPARRAGVAGGGAHHRGDAWR